jgi:hypothetical protein
MRRSWDLTNTIRIECHSRHCMTSTCHLHFHNLSSPKLNHTRKKVIRRKEDEKKKKKKITDIFECHDVFSVPLIVA